MELNEKLRVEEEKLNRRNLLKNAFVDTIEPVIILEALEGSNWKLIMQIGGEVLCNFQKEYKNALGGKRGGRLISIFRHREQVEKVCKDLQEAATLRFQKRDRETNLFKNCVQNACRDNKTQSLK
jgi:hypothetical protein